MTEQYQRRNINDEDPEASIRNLTSADDGATLEPNATYFIDTTDAAATFNLPPAADGGSILVKNTGGNQLTISRSGGDTIDGAETAILSNIFDAAEFVSNGQSFWGIW